MNSTSLWVGFFPVPLYKYCTDLILIGYLCDCQTISMKIFFLQADVYLLDDPLSAVDAHVGRQLFDECINGYLRHTTRVLVTHQLHYLKAADYIVIMNNVSILNPPEGGELLIINIMNDKPFSADNAILVMLPSNTQGFQLNAHFFIIFLNCYSNWLILLFPVLRQAKRIKY